MNFENPFKKFEPKEAKDATERALSEGRADKIRSEMMTLDLELNEDNFAEIWDSIVFELPEASEEVLKLLNEDEISKLKAVVKKAENWLSKQEDRPAEDQRYLPEIREKVELLKEQLGI